MSFKDLFQKDVEEAKPDKTQKERIAEEISNRHEDMLYFIGEILDNYKKASKSFNNLDKRMFEFFLSMLSVRRKINHLKRNSMINGASTKNGVMKINNAVIKINDQASMRLPDYRQKVRRMNDSITNILDMAMTEEDFISDDKIQEIRDYLDDNSTDFFQDFLKIKEEFKSSKINNPHYMFLKIKDDVKDIERRYEHVSGGHELPLSRDEHEVEVSGVEIVEKDRVSM